MAYTLSKTNGGTLTVLNDGLIDNASSSIKLIGKNVSNFGDAQNENFLHMLENFAYEREPNRPLAGQIWFDSAVNVVRPVVFDGTNWRPLAVSLYSSTSTDTLINAGGQFNFAASRPGDFWFDSIKKQLHVVTEGTTSATSTILIGPELVEGFNTSKLQSVRMLDNLGTPYPVIQITLNGEVLGTISAATFTPGASNTLAGFSRIYRGITFKNYNVNSLYTTATSDVQLHGLHEQLDQSFTRRNVDEHIESNWYIDNGKILNLGTAGNGSISWNPSASAVLVNSSGTIKLQSNSSNIEFTGNALVPSLSTITLGTSSDKFDSLYANSVNSDSVLALAVTASTVGVGTLTATVINTPSITVSTASVETAVINNLTNTNLNSLNLVATTATISNLTATAITTPLLVATEVSATSISINTVSAVTVTANTFNGIEFNGGIVRASEIYDSGNRVLTSATVGNFELNAIRLKGEGATGYIQASISNVGNTVVQRDSSNKIFSSVMEVGSLRAQGGLNSSIGLITGQWNLTSGSTMQASYADLAEKYLADADYEPGTVLEFGGKYEVTVAEDSTRRVAGIVSTNPAHVLNADLTGDNVIMLALQGRVPCKVRGTVRKGDMMVAAGNGYARAEFSPIMGSVIGKALEDFSGVNGVIEVVVGRL
jgi:hypothetical protein